ncbi:LysR family transcriptional regulator [Spiribacter sp. C176]|uniref:LysR family transcriptional regulator n=1 Tax=Spiribacter salilacus TaxID=2664894 RepID=A0A6N7QXL9_9GAMM|nr:hydrogen peroxide-inducible genes activator [Spiribacter salilacus]MRH77414.1 LysR family transcriptional regulator [Spiribacter salilacus]
MNDISLRQLRYFDALARHRHFGKAARDCSVSQPALSVQIRELETSLGATLVERGARQITLSSLGEALAERAHRILQEVDELTDLARASGNPLAGPLRFGVIPTIAPYLLPAFIQQLKQHYPALQLQPRESITETLLRDIAENRLDVAMVALPVADSSLHEAPLLTERFVLVRPAADADQPVPDLNTLRTMRLLLLEEGHCFREQTISYCNLRPRGGQTIMEASTLSTLVQLVGSGIGITLLPEMAIPIETAAASVSVTTLPDPQPTRRVGLVWRKNHPLSDSFTALVHLGRIAAGGEFHPDTHQPAQIQDCAHVDA